MGHQVTVLPEFFRVNYVLFTLDSHGIKNRKLTYSAVSSYSFYSYLNFCSMGSYRIVVRGSGRRLSIDSTIWTSLHQGYLGSKHCQLACSVSRPKTPEELWCPIEIRIGFIFHLLWFFYYFIHGLTEYLLRNKLVPVYGNWPQGAMRLKKER